MVIPVSPAARSRPGRRSGSTNARSPFSQGCRRRSCAPYFMACRALTASMREASNPIVAIKLSPNLRTRLNGTSGQPAETKSPAGPGRRGFRLPLDGGRLGTAETGGGPALGCRSAVAKLARHCQRKSPALRERDRVQWRGVEAQSTQFAGQKCPRAIPTSMRPVTNISSIVRLLRAQRMVVHQVPLPGEPSGA
jgi:hypothetical protein